MTKETQYCMYHCHHQVEDSNVGCKHIARLMTSEYPPRIYPGLAVRLQNAPIDWQSLYPESSAPSTPVRNGVPATNSMSAPIKGSTPETVRPTRSLLSMRQQTADERLEEILSTSSVDIMELRKASWGGLPHEQRPTAWRLLLGHLPAVQSRRDDILARRRREYREAVASHYPKSDEQRAAATSVESDSTMRQIAVDIPRTCPEHRMFHTPAVQAALTRVLYVWAVRHPASGYVQGMNDLVTPFFFVFLSEHFASRGMALLDTELDVMDANVLDKVEADAYWCLTALLNDIQDYYTFSQPGIQRRVLYLAELVGRVDAPLRKHLEDEGLDFLQFAFRWMNCLLMRELPFPLIVRAWDTYLSEPEGFGLFHVFVCAALLVSFSDRLMEMDFQNLVMFLQKLPTKNWSSKDIDILLSQAYLWRSIFGAAPSHLQNR